MIEEVVREINPMCRVCGKRVDKVVKEMSLASDVVTYVAFCHGAVETLEVPAEAIEDYGEPTGWKTAFVALPRIPNTPGGTPSL